MEDWNIRKARLREKFSKIIGTDVIRLESSEIELIDRLEKRLGKSREAIVKLLSDL